MHMEILDLIYKIATLLLTVPMLYQVIYTVIGFFTREKTFPAARENHRYGIIIAARNESAVIGNLLESINRQHYDMSRVRIFVVADNCTDNGLTAEICRSHGATVYERHDPTRARKGYALEYLFEQIDRDFGIDAFEGYVFFDADNLLHPDFLAELNKAFDTGTDVAVGYRNSKNFARNAISASYGLHFMRSSLTMHRPRARLGLPTHIAGTGYVIRAEHLLGGWHYTSLTEDTQFTLSRVADGKHIEFCETAEFFDEQPYQLRVSFRQRLRWEKGRLFCFFRTAGGLLRGIFKKPQGGSRFACYDMFFYALPKSLISALLSVIYTVAAAILTGVVLSGGDPLGTALDLLWVLAQTYLGFLFIGILTAIRERRHIKCSLPRLIWYVLAFPWFDLVGLPIAIVSLFMRVKWKPIKHDEAIRVEELVEESDKTRG